MAMYLLLFFTSLEVCLHLQLDTHLFDMHPTNITQGENAANYIVAYIFLILWVDLIISIIGIQLHTRDPL